MFAVQPIWHAFMHAALRTQLTAPCPQSCLKVQGPLAQTCLPVQQCILGSLILRPLLAYRLPRGNHVDGAMASAQTHGAPRRGLRQAPAARGKAGPPRHRSEACAKPWPACTSNPFLQTCTCRVCLYKSL